MTFATLKKAKFSSGFTLIELLVVIAILGILAAGLLVLLDPPEMLARARDASRKSNLGVLARSMQSYYTSQGKYLNVGSTANNWQGLLAASGEIKQPATVTGTPSTGECLSTRVQNGYCYNWETGWTDAVIWTALESKSEIERARLAANPSNPATGTCPVAIYIWGSAQGKTGYACLTAHSAATMPTAATTIY